MTIDKSTVENYHSGIPGDGENVSMAKNRLLTIQETCEFLRVPKSYIYSLTCQKKIPHIKMQGHLRFRQSAINEWLKTQEIHDAEDLPKETQEDC